MAETEAKACCRGTRVATREGQFTAEAVRSACREEIQTPSDATTASGSWR